MLAIENAIEISSNPTSDHLLKSQADQYLEQIRLNPEGWQACVALFTRPQRASEVVRFVALGRVNEAILDGALDLQYLVSLRNVLLDYIRANYASYQQSQPDSFSLQNKLAQILTTLFVGLYREGWESFIDDFLALTISPGSSQRDNVTGIILYLRVLISINEEIAGHSSRHQDSTILKDLLRERDVRKMAQSWRELLELYNGQNDEVVMTTLTVLGEWVSWIDITLITNTPVFNTVRVIVERMNTSGANDKIRDAAINTIKEIVRKKMRPADKTQMIEHLELENIISTLVESPPLKGYQGTSLYDTDLAEAVGKLVNTIMTELLLVLAPPQKGVAVDSSTREKATGMVRRFVDPLLRFFSDEYDEVCSTVIQSLDLLLQYFGALVNNGGSLEAFSGKPAAILDAIIKKMRYDETSDWSNEDDETDEFQQLRKGLRGLQKTFASMDADLFINVWSSLVEGTFRSLEEQGIHLNWRDLELALHEMHLFGELGIDFGSSSVGGQTLTKLMNVAKFPDVAVIPLQYVEICSRYISLIKPEYPMFGRILESFDGLLRHESAEVREESYRLFFQFIKQFRAVISNGAETIIRSIVDLLIKPKVPSNSASKDIYSNEPGSSATSLWGSQMNLFRAIGCISSTADIPTGKQAEYVHLVMEPLFADMERHLAGAKSGDIQAILQVHYTITAVGTLGQSFYHGAPGGQNSKLIPTVVSDEFASAARVILITLSELNNFPIIRDGCRSALTHLIEVLGSAMLPQLRHWIDGLLPQGSSKQEMASFLDLLGHVIYKYKTEFFNDLDTLLTPLLQRVLGGLKEPISGTDDEAQLNKLRLAHVAFLGSILNSDLKTVFISPSNQDFLNEMISSIVDIATDINFGDMRHSRAAVILLTKMAEEWGGEDVASISENPTYLGTPSPRIAGFDGVLIDRFHVACWQVLDHQQFRPSTDAQSKQLLNEISDLERIIYRKTGRIFIEHLQSTLFPQLGIDGEQFLRSMATSKDRSILAKYLQALKESKLTR
ncbi:hypothetical protein NUW58_g5620 [Xylaria curta]|uniref:Uncharacterized protein n=1 Tax=Xylaria curta TaxID=42375 RepID=A0ACC1P1I8_9PEZI|nr:hypothetical protein NUW58_g5620 [Xylaria curta]